VLHGINIHSSFSLPFLSLSSHLLQCLLLFLLLQAGQQSQYSVELLHSVQNLFLFLKFSAAREEAEIVVESVLRDVRSASDNGETDVVLTWEVWW